MSLIAQNMKLTGIKQRQRNVEVIDFRDWEAFVTSSYRVVSRNDLRKVITTNPSKK